MSSTVRTAELLVQAQELTREERVHLAYQLLDEAFESDSEWWAETKPEIDKIAAAVASGEMETIPLEEVQRRIRERIARRAD